MSVAVEDPKLWSPHSEKQDKIIFSDARFFIAATGLQFGKTLAGAMWMKLMMHTHTDPNDTFIITSPSFPILRQSTLPPFLELMQGLGHYNKQENTFRMYGGGTCYFRTAVDPHSIVGITNVRAILCDEAGLYSLYFWQQILMRASFRKAKIRIVTTPYARNWLWKDYVKPYLKDPNFMPGLEIIQATSRENPYFPEDEFEERRRTMDPRRFRMFYCAEFEQMVGLVYDCFDHYENVSKVQTLPEGTRYFGGIDWGTTAPFGHVVRAITPNGTHYEISEFKKAGMSLTDMIEILRHSINLFGVEMFYADPAGATFIEECKRAGIPITPANNDIDGGIQAHYELIRSRRYQVFEGKCPHLLDEMETYRYQDPIDVGPNQDEKTPKPVKQNDHVCFVAGTMVMTPSGEVPIEDLRIGDVVLTPLGPDEVTGWHRRDDQDVVRVGFGSVELVGTPEHPVLVLGDGFKRLDAMRYGDMVLTWDKCRQSMLFSTAKSIISRADIILRQKWVSRASAFMSLCGNSIVGLCLLVGMYTTRTAIRLIMSSKILSVCQEATTYANMAEIFHPKGLRKFEKISIASDTLPLSGTKATRAGHGIRSMVGRSWQRVRCGSYIAKIVQRVLKLRVHGSANFARTIVRLIAAANRVWTTKLALVKFARHLLKSTNIQGSDVAVQSVAASCPAKQSVYALSVGRFGCYFANGILVSNCDAARYVSIMTHNLKSPTAPKLPGGGKKRLTDVAHDLSILKSRNKKTESFNW